MRILVVEDEEKLCIILERGLRSDGYIVDVAATVRQALSCIESNNYDLAVLDVQLPDGSGTDILQHIRRSGIDIPILMLTAKDALQEKILHFENGADDYLTKPFSFVELLMRLKALLRRGQVQRPDQLRIGDLEIDRLTRNIRRAGRKIELSAKEYALLDHLANNAGRALSRAMIIEHVWDQSFETLTNIVDVYVRQLRMKVDDGFDHKLIRTVRGVGYMICAEEES